jgi:hypothetical protein
VLPESLNDALVECVKACGGSKAVGPALWPTKDVDAAQRHLLACLNPDRSERISPEGVLLILRMAREKGCHAGMQFVCAQLSYAEPVPIEPKDEADELRRQYIEATRTIARMAERIERLEAGGKPRAVA